MAIATINITGEKTASAIAATNLSNTALSSLLYLLKLLVEATSEFMITIFLSLKNLSIPSRTFLNLRFLKDEL
jgi:hypothetical protein